MYPNLYRNIIVKHFMIQPLGGITLKLISDIAKHIIVHPRSTTFYRIFASLSCTGFLEKNEGLSVYNICFTTVKLWVMVPTEPGA